MVETLPMIGFFGLFTFLSGLLVDLSRRPLGVQLPSIVILGLGITALVASIIHGSYNPMSPFRSPVSRLLSRSHKSHRRLALNYIGRAIMYLVVKASEG